MIFEKKKKKKKRKKGQLFPAAKNLKIIRVPIIEGCSTGNLYSREIMEEIQGILGHNDLSQDDCMSYLTRNPDIDSDLAMLFVDNSTLLEAGNIVDKLSNKEASCSRECLIHISAIIFSNVVDNGDTKGILFFSTTVQRCAYIYFASQQN
jgi:hypothetical protein